MQKKVIFVVLFSIILLVSTISFTLAAETNSDSGFFQKIGNWFKSLFKGNDVQLSPEESEVTTGLVAYYAGDGNANDDSGNGNNGTWNGAAMYSWEGKYDRAFNFNGTNSISANKSINDNKDWTLSSWVKLSTLSQTEYANILYVGNDYAGFGLAFLSGKFAGLFGSVAWIDTGYVFDTNWHHLAMSRDTSVTKLYVDGNLVKTYGGSPYTPNNYFTIGQQPRSNVNTDGRYFNGLVDEVRIYNRALSASEIAVLANKSQIACYNDSDCGASRNTTFCQNASVFCTIMTSYICNDPGTSNASCSTAGGGGCGTCTSGTTCSIDSCVPSQANQTCQSFGYNYGTVGSQCANSSQYDLSGCYNTTRTCNDRDLGHNQYYNASGVSGGFYTIYGPSCSGSSGGSGGGYSLSDSCFNSTLLREAFCNSTTSNAAVVNYTCPNGCSNGACVNQTLGSIIVGVNDVTTSPIKGLANCTVTLSKDGSIIRTVITNSTGNATFSNLEFGRYNASVVTPAGYVFGGRNHEELTEIDLYRETVFLDTDFMQGYLCNDSDNTDRDSNFYFVKGITISAFDGYVQHPDLCFNATVINESFCYIDGVPRYSLWSCPSRTTCSNGACTNQTIVSGCSLISDAIKTNISSMKTNGDTIVLKEAEKIYPDDSWNWGGYFVIPIHLMQLTDIINSSSGYSSDRVRMKDAFSGIIYEATLAGEGVGTITIDANVYGLNYYGQSESLNKYIILDYPQTTGHDILSFENCPPEQQEQVCQPLIDRIKSPADFYLNGYQYYHSWNNSYTGTWWINNTLENYTEYASSWYLNSYRGDKYEDQYVNYDLIVFDGDVDTSFILNDITNYQVCKISNYYDAQGKANPVYICNWDILEEQQDTGAYDFNSREIIWNNGNVFVRVYVHQGSSLTEEEIAKITQNRLNQFISDLKDNRNKYIDWSNFEIDYPLNDFIAETIGEECQSGINIDDLCYPSWNCKIEPVVCPEYGYQTKTCIDYSCDKKIVEQMQCSPGICSGCYVPRWFNYYNPERKIEDNRICMPYGTRFVIKNGESGIITANEMQPDQSRINVSFNGDGSATFNVLEDLPISVTIDGQEYTGKAGESVTIYAGRYYDVSYKYIESYSQEEVKMSIYISNMVYDSENPGNSYIEGRVGGDDQNVYCDIDGNIKQQKDKDYNGEWAKCQNNYECESNICSYGECINTKALAQELTGFKGFVVRILCKLSNMMDDAGYAQCLSDNLGTESSSGGSSGGWGGGSTVPVSP